MAYVESIFGTVLTMLLGVPLVASSNPNRLVRPVIQVCGPERGAYTEALRRKGRQNPLSRPPQMLDQVRQPLLAVFHPRGGQETPERIQVSLASVQGAA